MALDLMSIVARLSMDSSEYEKGLDKAKGGLSDFSKGVSNMVSTAKKAIAAIGIGAAVKKGVDTLKQGISDVAAFGDNIDKASQKLGISAQAYQEWDAVMQHSGTSIDSMSIGMKTLASKAAEGSDAFKALGISQQDAAKMSREQLFSKTITALQNVGDANKKAQLAQELFGRSAMELGPLLNTSAKDTQAMKDRVNELGGVMSNEAVKASAAYQDSLQDMNTAMDGWKRGLFATFLPSVTRVMDGVTDLFAGAKGGAKKIKKGIQDFIDNLGTELPKFLGKGLKIAEAVGGAVVSAIPSVVTRITGALPKIFQKLSTFVRTKGIPAIAKLIGGLFGKGQSSSLVNHLTKNLQKIWQDVSGILSSIGAKVKEFWTVVVQPILFNLLNFVTKRVLPGIHNALIKLRPILDQIGPVVSAAFQAIADFWSNTLYPVLGQIWDFVSGQLIPGVIDVIGSVTDFFVDLWDKVQNQQWGEIGSMIWNGIKAGFNVVSGWLLKLILGDDYTPESGWGDAGAKIWDAIKDGFKVVNGWLLKLVLGKDYKPESGWGDAGKKIWAAIRHGFNVVSDWLLKLVLGDEWTPESGWGDAGDKIWGAIKAGFGELNEWLLKLLLGEEYTPESGWGNAGAKIWEAIKTGFGVVNDWLIKLLMGEEWTPESGWGDVGAKVWGAIKTGFGIASDWLIKLLLGEEEYTPDATWATVGEKIWGKIHEGLSSAVNWLQTLLTGWTEKLTDGSVDFESIGSSIWGAIKGAFSSVVGWFVKLFGGDSDVDEESVKGGILGIDWGGLGDSMWGLISAAFTGVAGIFKGWFEDAWNDINELDWSGLGDAMWGAIKDAFGSVAGWFEDTFSAPVNTVIGYINSMITSFENAYNRIVNAINSVLGTNFEQKAFDRIQEINKTIYGTDHVRGGGGKANKNSGAGRIKKFATGGILGEGQSAFVGEYAPELLRVIGGKAMVTPLSKVPARFPGGGQEMTVPRYTAPKNIVVKLILDGRELAQTQFPYLEAEEQRVGLKLAKGGV